MCTKKLIKALGLIIVVALLAAALPTGQAQAATVVTTEAELRDALAGTETQIELGASFTLTATVEVNRTVSIDGKGFIIYGPPRGAEAHQGHGLTVYADDVHISNLTITGSGRSNLNFYVATGGVVNNVVLSNAANAGMIVNGSVVTISNVTTSGNAWGGINVDQGVDVTATPLLTVTNVTNHTSPNGTLTPAIWVDKGNEAWVSVPQNSYIKQTVPNTQMLAFFDIDEFTAAFPVHNVTKDTYFTTIQAAIDAASDGDTILVNGTFVHTGTATLNKDITLTCATDAKIQVSGTGHSFRLSASGSSIEGCEIEKTDKQGVHNIISLEVSNVAVKNNRIHGQWALTDSDISRAMEVYAGSNTGLEISGNEIWGLRQPAYINGTNTGTVSNNYVHGTKGWVIEGGNLTFSGNTFAGNVGDIAILPEVPAEYYTDILALSAANDNAVVEDQRVSPAVLSVAYVDDSAAAGGNGTEASPYQSIQAGINRVIAGGTVNVAAGTYNENITINKAGITLQSTGTAEETIINANGGFGVYILKELGIVTIDGFTVKGWVTAGIVQGTANRPGTTSRILNNIVIGVTGDEDHGNCIQVTGDNSLIEGNTVTGAYYIGTGPYGASGILVYAANNVTVRNNTVSSADIGIAVAAGAYHNLGSISGVVVEDNEVSNSEIGISVSFDANGTSIKDNFVHGNQTGLYEEFYLGKGPTGTVALHNRIVDNVEQASTGATDDTPIPDDHVFTAENNWWGSVAGPGASQISGPVDFTPWCANAACTEFLPGAVSIAQVAPVVCGVTPTTTIDINVAGIPASIVAQGYQLTLHFDPAKTSIASEDDIVQGGFLPVGTGFQVLTIDNLNGTVEIASAIYGTATNDISKPLVKITLTHKGVAGNIDLWLSDVLLSDADGFPIPTEVSTTPVVLTLQPAVKNTTQSLDYCTLAEAVAGAADSGDVLQLQADIAIPATVTVDKALTLDLNGKVATYSTTDNSYALVVNGTGAALTVVDGISPSTGKILVVDADVDGVTDGRGIGVISGSLILESGTIQAPYAGVYVRPGTSMVMNGGTIGGTVDPLYGIAILGTGSSLDINGGVIEATYFAVTGNGTAGFGETTITIDGGILTSTTAAAIYHPQDGNLTITAGTISGINGIEMKAGNLVVTGGTILGTGAYADPVANDNGSVETGDAILLNGRDAYTGDITVNITGGIITSTNAYALRDYKAADQALKTSAVLVSGGTFSGGIQAVTFSDEFVALPRTATTGLMLTGGLYNTDPAYPDVFVFVPYGTILDGSMYRIVGISLNVHDFYYANYDTGHGILRGVSTDFYATNFVFADATSVTVQLFSGTEGAYVLQQTNTLKNPLNHPGDVLTSSFDIFGTYVSNSWANTREKEYGQTVAPTRVLVTVVLPGGTLTGSSNILTGNRTAILPEVNGLVTLQGILAPRAGVEIKLTSDSVVRTTSSTALSDINYSFTGVETLTYTFTTNQARYLNVTTDSHKTLLVNGDKTLNPLRLYGGDVNQDDKIEVNDASIVGTYWGSTANPNGNVNFDSIVNIQDLALVGGNYGLTSATAYGSWSPLP